MTSFCRSRPQQTGCTGPVTTGLDRFFAVFTGSSPVFLGFGNIQDQSGLSPAKKWPKNRTGPDLRALMLLGVHSHIVLPLHVHLPHSPVKFHNCLFTLKSCVEMYNVSNCIKIVNGFEAYQRSPVVAWNAGFVTWPHKSCLYDALFLQLYDVELCPERAHHYPVQLSVVPSFIYHTPYYRCLFLWSLLFTWLLHFHLTPFYLLYIH